MPLCYLRAERCSLRVSEGMGREASAIPRASDTTIIVRQWDSSRGSLVARVAQGREPPVTWLPLNSTVWQGVTDGRPGDYRSLPRNIHPVHRLRVWATGRRGRISRHNT